MSLSTSSSQFFKIYLAFYFGFTRDEVKRRLLISNASAGNITSCGLSGPVSRYIVVCLF
jgi:hypothetical protein